MAQPLARRLASTGRFSMDRVDKLYDYLAQGPAPDCDRVFAAALEHAESPYFERIIEHLLRRDNDAAWAGLIASYPRLSPEVRRRLWANAGRLRAGLALALTTPDARTRRHGLKALREQPCPRLAYLLPDTLRDTSGEVRKAAARTLRRMAEVVLDERPAGEWEEVRHQESALARREVTKALREALRTFDLHYRQEVVEVSLWFVQDLGAELWHLLANRRSQCGNVASTQLSSWESPRLARFLLEALAQPAWRVLARQILRSYQSAEEVSAILRNSDVLADAEIRRRLGGLKQPSWFQRAGEDLSGLSSDVRGSAPRWVCHLGFSEAQKVGMLSRWLDVGGPEVRSACVYALAELDTPEALARLAEVAAGKSSLATFARWYVAGKRDGGVDSVATEQAPSGRPPMAESPKPAAAGTTAHDAPADLRPACQPSGLVDDAVLIGLVRENMDVCRAQLCEFLHSEDPGDRLLGLRVIAGAQCANDFRQELQRLRADSVDVIRRLSRTVLEATSPAAPAAPLGTGQEPGSSVTSIGETTGRACDGRRPDSSPKPDQAAVRSELRRALARLLGEERDPESTAELIRRVRALLRQLSARSANTPGHPAVGSEVHK